MKKKLLAKYLHYKTKEGQSAARKDEYFTRVYGDIAMSYFAVLLDLGIGKGGELSKVGFEAFMAAVNEEHKALANQ